MDLAAFTNYASESIGGRSGWKNPLAPNPAEENAFYGWPLCVLAIGFGIIYWRVMAVRIAFVVGLLLTLLSLGNEVRINARDIGVPGLWKAVSGLPLFDAIIVTRMAMGVAFAIAVILAIAAEKMITVLASADPRRRKPLWVLTACAVAAALVPVFPTPLPATGEKPIPAFFSDGSWRKFVDDGTVVPVPPVPWSEQSLNWLVASGMEMRITDGYFIGPTNEHNAVAAFGSPQRPTAFLWREIAFKGEVPRVTERQRRQAFADLRYWRADVLVLYPQKHEGDLRRVVNQLLGISGVGVGDVWVWDVRGLV